MGKRPASRIGGSPLAQILRPEAEWLAREAFEAHMAALARVTGRPTVTWGRLFTDERESYVSAHLALLTDLSRPASMDVLARWLAGRMGLKVGATAPRWTPSECHSDWGGLMWTLETDIYADVIGNHACFTSDAPEDNPTWIAVPGISALTDPAEALATVSAARGLGAVVTP